MKWLCSIVLVAAVGVLPLRGAEPQGKPVVEETFDAAELGKPWTKQFGAWKVEDGALVVSQQESDKHAAAFRYRHALKDGTIEVLFRMEGAKGFHLGFDPAPGELKKKGHLFNVIVTPRRATIQLSKDKADPQSTNETLATVDASFRSGVTYKLVLELKGAKAAAVIRDDAGNAVAELSAEHPSFAVKKPGLVFRVIGGEDEAVRLESVRVWGVGTE